MGGIKACVPLWSTHQGFTELLIHAHTVTGSREVPVSRSLRPHEAYIPRQQKSFHSTFWEDGNQISKLVKLNMLDEEQMCSLAVKAQTPTSQIRVPGFDLQLQLPASADTRGQQWQLKWLGSRHTGGQTWIALPAPGSWLRLPFCPSLAQATENI